MGFREFVVEVPSELRRVNWPTRHQVINHSVVVLATITFAIALTAVLGWVFGQGVLQLLRLGS